MRSTRRDFLRSALRATGGARLVGGAALVGGAGCVQPNAAGRTGQRKPSALVAGSLLALAAEIPGAHVEAHGSLTVRRLLLDGARDPDVVALADPTLFEGVAEAVTLFATNELTIAYHPKSPHASALQDDWVETLQQPDVTVGRTNPETDPLGYRTVLALELAAKRGVADRPGTILSNTAIFPETQLMQVLAQGKLDAAFGYRNMAVEYDLPTVELPAPLNFSDPSYAETYGSVSLDLPSRTVAGDVIRYAATARTARGQPWFEELISNAGRLREHGFTVPEQYPTATQPDGTG